MAKKLKSAQIGFTFRLTDIANPGDVDRCYAVQNEAIGRIEKEMRTLDSFATTHVEGGSSYEVENYTVCGVDIDDLGDETVYPVWFDSCNEFSAQAHEELHALAKRIFSEVAAQHGVTCELVAREEYHEWVVSERKTTRLD